MLFNPDMVYFTLFGAPDQRHRPELPVVVTAVVLVALVGLMRFTSLGLQMRAARSRAVAWCSWTG